MVRVNKFYYAGDYLEMSGVTNLFQRVARVKTRDSKLCLYMKQFTNIIDAVASKYNGVQPFQRNQPDQLR